MTETTESTIVALVVQRLDQLERKLDKVVEDHERRIRRLEAWSYGIPVAALTSLGSVIVAIIATRGR